MLARGSEFYLRVDHEKIKLSTSRHVIFCLLYKHTNDNVFKDVFNDFPKISEHLPKISEKSSKVVRGPDERFRIFSEDYGRFPKITKDFRGRTDVSIIEQ